jgi:hypothetical protein
MDEKINSIVELSSEGEKTQEKCYSLLNNEINLEGLLKDFIS